MPSWGKCCSSSSGRSRRTRPSDWKTQAAPKTSFRTHAARRTLTTNQPGLTGASPEPTSWRRASSVMTHRSDPFAQGEIRKTLAVMAVDVSGSVVIVHRVDPVGPHDRVNRRPARFSEAGLPMVRRSPAPLRIVSPVSVRLGQALPAAGPGPPGSPRQTGELTFERAVPAAAGAGAAAAWHPHRRVTLRP
jgi:hypothetical protein